MRITDEMIFTQHSRNRTAIFKMFSRGFESIKSSHGEQLCNYNLLACDILGAPYAQSN
jgi:hypothetical protein